MNALAYVDRMPAVVCHACGWWQYDVPTDTPRGGNRPPVHCPECIKHHGARHTPTPAWACPPPWAPIPAWRKRLTRTVR